tara:strand:- start:156 stop:971 length:816 start_codon:yes stop_codon:yes gene_type:complete
MAEKKSNEAQTNPVEEAQILEVDRAVYNWFKNTNKIVIDSRSVPVIFGAWERFAQIQGNKTDRNIDEIRDKSGKIKLPMISIKRGDITPNEERYLSLNKDSEPYIVYQKKIATSKFDRRRVPFTKKWIAGNSSRYLTSAPVYEAYLIPYPTFINLNYTITFWASYIKHANMFHDIIWNQYRVSNMKSGDWFFYSYFDGSTDESNTEDFSTEERIIRHSFNLQIEAYLINKDDVKVSRTPSKFVFEETLLDADAEGLKEAITTEDERVLQSF